MDTTLLWCSQSKVAEPKSIRRTSVLFTFRTSFRLKHKHFNQTERYIRYFLHTAYGKMSRYHHTKLPKNILYFHFSKTSPSLHCRIFPSQMRWTGCFLASGLYGSVWKWRYSCKRSKYAPNGPAILCMRNTYMSLESCLNSILYIWY